MMKLAITFGPLWFAANYIYNASLAEADVPSVTVLSTTSALFALVFGVMHKVDKFSLRRLLCILMTYVSNN